MKTLNPSTLNAFLDHIAASAAAGQGTLVPYGEALAMIFAAFSVMAFGWAIFGGHANMIPAVARMSGASGLVIAGMPFWPRLTGDCLSGARQAIGLVTHGYDGPSTLFTMAQDVVGRLSLEAGAMMGLSPWSWWEAVNIGLDSLFMLIGLSLTGLWAIGAEFELLIGATMAPLILPFLCFGVTAPLGWGIIRFMVYGSLRVATMGIASYVLANAMTTVVGMPGTDKALTGEQLCVLLLLSLASLVMGWAVNRVASAIISGGIGSLGVGSLISAGSSTASVARAGSIILGGGASLAAGGASLAGAGISAGISAYRGGGGGGGSGVTSSGGGGNAFRRGSGSKGVSLA